MNAEILKTSPLVVDLAKADRWNGALPLTLPRALVVRHCCRCSPAKHPQRSDAKFQPLNNIVFEHFAKLDD
jgi:hypothetical protein